nr:Agenet domain containing protein [Ipomoea batatas]
MMRYKKGNLVEVLNENELPSGSWRCAEIVRGNEENYIVRYSTSDISEAVVERVSRKLIRPCPPLVEFSENLMPGDVVEVFLSFTWKMATVSKVIGKDHVLVRLVGSANGFKVKKCNIRVRQSWKDGQWAIVGKGPAQKYNRISGFQSMGTKPRIGFHGKQDHALNNDVKFHESYIGKSRTLKRGLPYCDSQTEANNVIAQKYRVIEKEGGRCRGIAAHYSPLRGKVGNNPLTGKVLVEKERHFIENHRSSLFELDVERTKAIEVVSHAMPIESNDADSVSSSVGSCSIATNNMSTSHCKLLVGFADDIQEHSSDAESVQESCNRQGNCFPTSRELATEIHRLELYAYRATMEALYASGPLSWEQETLITNLRIYLNISNDEHLLELRNLISNASSFSIS